MISNLLDAFKDLIEGFAEVLSSIFEEMVALFRPSKGLTCNYDKRQGEYALAPLQNVRQDDERGGG